MTHLVLLARKMTSQPARAARLDMFSTELHVVRLPTTQPPLPVTKTVPAVKSSVEAMSVPSVEMAMSSTATQSVPPAQLVVASALLETSPFVSDALRAIILIQLVSVRSALKIV